MIRRLLAFALFLSLLGHVGCMGRDGGEEVRQTFSERYPLEPGGRVSLKNTNGRVTVRAWERDEVQIEAEKIARAPSRRRAKQVAEATRIEVKARPSSIVVDTDYPRRRGLLSRFVGGNANVQVRYDLTVPRHVGLTVRVVNGKIEVTGVDGKVRVETINGGIRLDDCSGSIHANTVNGALRAEVTRLQLSDRISMKAVNGAIHLYIPEDAAVDIKARTVNGSVWTSLEVPEAYTHTRKRLEASLNGGGARIDLATTNGSIDISPVR